MVWDGVPSASYAVCIDNEPILLIGCGFGVVQQCLKYFNTVPPDVFVFSNRSHYAAELPVLLSVTAAEGRPRRVLSSAAVQGRLTGHRLAEVHQWLQRKQQSLDHLASFREVPQLGPVELSTMQRVEQSDPIAMSAIAAEGIPLAKCPSIFARCFPTATTESSAGLSLHLSSGELLFAFTGDSAPNGTWESLFGMPYAVVVTDGRPTATADHCSFRNVADATAVSASSSRLHATRRVLVGHYGSPADAPNNAAIGTVALPAVESVIVSQLISRDGRKMDTTTVSVQPENRNLSVPSSFSSSRPPSKVEQATGGGASFPLSPSDRSAPQRNPTQQKLSLPSESQSFRIATVSSAARSKPTTLSTSTASAAAAVGNTGASPLPVPSLGTNERYGAPTQQSSSAPLRIYLFSNEDREQAGRLVMSDHYRSVQQLRMKASELLGIKPVSDIYIVPSGDLLLTMDQLVAGSFLVVCRSDGERFSLLRLPRVLQKRFGSNHNGGTHGASPPSRRSATNKSTATSAMLESPPAEKAMHSTCDVAAQSDPVRPVTTALRSSHPHREQQHPSTAPPSVKKGDPSSDGGHHSSSATAGGIEEEEDELRGFLQRVSNALQAARAAPPPPKEEIAPKVAEDAPLLLSSAPPTPPVRPVSSSIFGGLEGPALLPPPTAAAGGLPAEEAAACDAVSSRASQSTADDAPYEATKQPRRAVRRLSTIVAPHVRPAPKQSNTV